MALSERQRLYGGLQPVSAGDPKTLLLPAVDWETIGASVVEYMLFLSSITGGPTTSKLTAKMQKAHSASTGEDWIIPAWQDFTDHDVQHRCLGGVGWGYQDPAGAFSYPRPTDRSAGVLHDSTISAAVGYIATLRIIEPYEKMRIQLAVTSTGPAATYLIAPYAHIVRGGN
jgi:hypothetical protein